MGILDSIFGAEEQIESTAIDANSNLCQDCKNEGVPILPVIGRKLKLINESKKVEASMGVGDQRQRITQGFIYVYYENKNLWEGYQVDKNSCIRRINLDSPIDLEARDFGCDVSGHNDKLKFITLNPKYGSNVWIAYSVYPWTKNVRNQYAKDGYKTDKLTKSASQMRVERMLPLSLSASQVKAKNTSKNSVVDLNSSSKAIFSTTGLNANYKNFDLELNDKYLNELHSLNPNAGVNRIDTSIFIEMDKVDEKATPAVVFLEDPVGDFAILNNQRNYCVSVVETIRQSGVHDKIGYPSQEEFEHKLTTAGFIDGILKGAGPLGSQKYKQRLKLEEFEAYREIYKSIETFQKSYLIFDGTMVQNLKDDSCIWKYIQTYDFDGEDVESILHHRDMVLSSFLGSGTAEFYEALGMDSIQQSGTLIQVGDWILNTLCNLQPELVSAILSHSQSNINSDRLYDVLKGDIQSSLLLLTEYLETNGDQYNKLYSNLRGYRLSEETANAISLLISHAYQSVLTNQRKRQTGSIPKAKVQSITTAMQSFMLSNSGEVAIPITMKGKIKAIFDNLKGVNGADLYDSYTSSVEGNKLSTNKQPFDVQDIRNRGGATVQSEAVHTFTFFVSAQYKKGIMLDTSTLKELGRESNRPLVNLVETEIRKDPTTTYLQSEVDKINSRLKRLDSLAPSAGIALSGGLIFLQTRAMFTNLEAMGRDVSLSKNMELGSAAIGASLMVMSATIELAANLTQLRAVTKELQIKAAQRSLLAATIGLFAGWVEVGYIVIYKFNRTEIPNEYIFTNIGSVVAFSVAGRALAEVMAKRTGARLSVMYAFSQAGGIALFANPYFLVGVMVVGLGVSLWSYFKMSVYNKSTDNLSNIDYWLDFGTFGKRELLTDKYSDKNSYIDSDSNKVLSSFRSAASEVAALALDMRKINIEITIKNSVTSKCNITVEITSYLPISKKDTISYEITTFYKEKEYQYNPYSDHSDFDPSSYIKHPVTVDDSVPLNKLLKVNTQDGVFTRIGQTSRKNQTSKIELPKGLSSYKYTQTEGGYKLLLTFVIYESSFKFDRVDFSLLSAAYDKESGITYTQKIPKSKTVEEKPYVMMRDR